MNCGADWREVLTVRMIDADALLRALPDDLPYKGSVRRVLMQAPEVDAVPVVRCKECLYWYDTTSAGVQTFCEIFRDHCEPNDFCSRGERREDTPCE